MYLRDHHCHQMMLAAHWFREVQGLLDHLDVPEPNTNKKNLGEYLLIMNKANQIFYNNKVYREFILHQDIMCFVSINHIEKLANIFIYRIFKTT